MAMAHPASSSKRSNLIVVIAVLACTAALLSIGWARPEPLAQVKMGSEWQCSRKAAILTVCTRISHAEPTFNREQINPVQLQQV
jgi:hypothetical protein